MFNHVILFITNKVWLVGHLGDGHRSDHNMLVKDNNMRLNELIIYIFDYDISSVVFMLLILLFIMQFYLMFVVTSIANGILSYSKHKLFAVVVVCTCVVTVTV